MSDLLLTGLESQLMSSLAERAHGHGRTPEEEARAIIEMALVKPESDPWTAVDAIFRRLQDSGRTFGDSAELIREDRDR